MIERNSPPISLKNAKETPRRTCLVASSAPVDHGADHSTRPNRNGSSTVKDYGGLTIGNSSHSIVTKPWYNTEAEKARRNVTKMFKNFPLEDRTNALPTFAQNECTLGKFLGKGAFGTVHEIREILVHRENSVSVDENDRGDRDFFAQHCKRDSGEARYAMKCLKSEIMEDRLLYCQGVANMAIEARILGAIEHPNIIKLRATAACDMYQQPGFFLIMDRLYDTLDRRLIKWQRRHRRSTNLLSLFDRKSKQKSALLEERLVAAFDLSAALQYLHSKKILHRDLKPDNIGFDIRGDIKLFDFSLATELHSKVPDKDGTYNLTGMTGSLRYMSPEVALEKPYNETSDVYSFAILFWEMYALMTPFALLTSSVFKKYVFERDTRPNINEAWPLPIKIMLKRCWSKEIGDRLSMKDVTSILKKEITHLRGGDDSGLEHTRRRSSFVYRKDQDTHSPISPQACHLS